MTGYAVFDIETTGFQAKPDSIVEIAVVHVDAGGQITGSWETLLKPAGTVGPTHVHGVAQSMVQHAPSFADVARSLYDLFAGRVAVAHNLRSFDGRFMATHFAEAGIDGSSISEGICTLSLARRVLPGPSYKLEDCCRALGIPLDGAHEALADATATAHMFSRLLPHVGTVGKAVGPAHVPQQGSGVAQAPKFYPRSLATAV